MVIFILRLLDLVLALVYVSNLLLGVQLFILKKAGLQQYLQYQRLRFWWLLGKWPALIACFSTPAINLLEFGHCQWSDYVFPPVFFLLWWLLRNVGDDDFFQQLKARLQRKAQQLTVSLVPHSESAW